MRLKFLYGLTMQRMNSHLSSSQKLETLSSRKPHEHSQHSGIIGPSQPLPCEAVGQYYGKTAGDLKLKSVSPKSIRSARNEEHGKEHVD
jgi:hypothetical protein